MTGPHGRRAGPARRDPQRVRAHGRRPGPEVEEALDLGFADFRSLEARERACRPRRTLNRRLAPDVSWASTCCGARTAASVARMLADFHSRCAPSPDPEDVAGPARLRELWDIGFDALDSAGDAVDNGAVAEARDLVHAYLHGRAPLLHERIHRGLVRDGHGDLLADDIFCLPDGPRVLDCLDFDPGLRHGDVLGDVAMLAMDLERLGATEAAAQLLHEYEEFSAEHHPPSLTHLYIAYRAQVRAKVALIRAAQTADPVVCDSRAAAGQTSRGAHGGAPAPHPGGAGPGRRPARLRQVDRRGGPLRPRREPRPQQRPRPSRAAHPGAGALHRGCARPGLPGGPAPRRRRAGTGLGRRPGRDLDLRRPSRGGAGAGRRRPAARCWSCAARPPTRSRSSAWDVDPPGTPRRPTLPSARLLGSKRPPGRKPSPSTPTAHPPTPSRCAHRLAPGARTSPRAAERTRMTALAQDGVLREAGCADHAAAADVVAARLRQLHHERADRQHRRRAARRGRREPARRAAGPELGADPARPGGLTDDLAPGGGGHALRAARRHRRGRGDPRGGPAQHVHRLPAGVPGGHRDGFAAAPDDPRGGRRA